MNETISIREATIDDLPILREFEQGVVNAEREFTERLVDGEVQYYDLNFLMESPESRLLVAVANHELIGSGYASLRLDEVYFHPRRFAYLGFMYVTPDWRGQQVVHRIIEELLNWAKGREVTSYKLDVFAENQAAIRAYEKFGFKAETIEMLKQD